MLLCDEATSALDPKTTHSILKLISDINRRLGITVIIITHQMSVVEEICNRVAILDHGTVAEEGDVATVFSQPQTEAARRLVFPDSSSDVLSADIGGRKLRIVFNGNESAGAPLVASMAIDCGIAASILYASTRLLGGKVYGSMVLGLPEEGDTFDRAMRYLLDNGIVVEEVVSNG